MNAPPSVVYFEVELGKYFFVHSCLPLANAGFMIGSYTELTSGSTNSQGCRCHSSIFFQIESQSFRDHHNLR